MTLVSVCRIAEVAGMYWCQVSVDKVMTDIMSKIPYDKNSHKSSEFIVINSASAL